MIIICSMPAKCDVLITERDGNGRYIALLGCCSSVSHPQTTDAGLSGNHIAPYVQGSRAVAGKPRDAAVNFDQLFVFYCYI